MLSLGPSSWSGGKASQSWNPRVRPELPAPPPCQAPPAALNHSTPPAGKKPGGAGRVFVADAALPKISERRDARMRMPPDARKRPSLGIEEIEKNERLESLAEL